MDPLQVLACLAPADAKQQASQALPSLGDALKDDVSDLFEQAKRKLLKVGPFASRRGLVACPHLLL